MKKWIAVISIGTTALITLELYLRFKDKKNKHIEKMFDDFSEGLRTQTNGTTN